MSTEHYATMVSFEEWVDCWPAIVVYEKECFVSVKIRWIIHQDTSEVKLAVVARSPFACGFFM